MVLQVHGLISVMELASGNDLPRQSAHLPIAESASRPLMHFN